MYVIQVLRWWSCSSCLYSRKQFTKPSSSQHNGYGYAISHPGCYSVEGSFEPQNSVDAHLMRGHQTEVLKHFHPPGSSSVSSWGFFWWDTHTHPHILRTVRFVHGLCVLRMIFQGLKSITPSLSR